MNQAQGLVEINVHMSRVNPFEGAPIDIDDHDQFDEWDEEVKPKFSVFNLTEVQAKTYYHAVEKKYIRHQSDIVCPLCLADILIVDLDYHITRCIAFKYEVMGRDVTFSTQKRQLEVTPGPRKRVTPDPTPTPTPSPPQLQQQQLQVLPSGVSPVQQVPTQSGQSQQVIQVEPSSQITQQVMQQVMTGSDLDISKCILAKSSHEKAKYTTGQTVCKLICGSAHIVFCEIGHFKVDTFIRSVVQNLGSIQVLTLDETNGAKSCDNVLCTNGIDGKQPLKCNNLIRVESLALPGVELKRFCSISCACKALAILGNSTWSNKISTLKNAKK